MAKKKEFTVEDKLRALYDLQLIDSRIDKIRSVRGELPLEVEDLEDEVAGLSLRISKFNEELDQFSEEILYLTKIFLYHLFQREIHYQSLRLQLR